jgi:hypothetical protein
MTAPLPEPTSIPASDFDRQGAAGDRTLRRVEIFSLIAGTAIALFYLVRLEWNALAGFTCSAAVVMINFRWLEDIVVQMLQPARRLKAWRLALRALARFALFGVAISIAIRFARSDALSVLLGFSVLVIGILTEAVYSGLRAPRS